MAGNHIKTFTDNPPRDKKRQRKSQSILHHQNAALAARHQASKRYGRMNLLFGVLVVVFAQYLFLFDGQEKINQSMPTVYSKLVNQFESLLGKINVGGSNPGENSGIY